MWKKDEGREAFPTDTPKPCPSHTVVKKAERSSGEFRSNKVLLQWTESEGKSLTITFSVFQGTTIIWAILRPDWIEL